MLNQRSVESPSPRWNEVKEGWPALLAAFLGVSCGIAGLYFYTVGVMLKPMQADLGWSRAGLSSVLLIGALTMASIAPLIGMLVDRIGVRRLAGVSMLGLAAGFYMFSKVGGTLANFLILNGVISIVAAGTSPVVLSRLIVVRFDKARGLALGAALAGMGVSGAVAPRLLAGYVADHGWRAGYQALALVALLAAPFVTAFAGERRNVADLSSNQPRRPVHSGIELRAAMRSGRFWHVAALFICVALGVGGVIVHFIPMLTDAGLPPQRAATLAGLVGVSLIVGRVATGALIDRIFAPHVAAALFAVAALGCFALLWGGTALAPFAAIAIGLAMGAEVDLIGYLVARYFGLRAYGAIYGWQYSAFMIGLAVSPLLAGLIFDSTHSYRYAVLGAGILLSAAVLIVARLGPFPNFDLPRQDEDSNDTRFEPKLRREAQ